MIFKVRILFKEGLSLEFVELMAKGFRESVFRLKFDNKISSGLVICFTVGLGFVQGILARRISCSSVSFT